MSEKTMREKIARATDNMAWDAYDQGFPPEEEHWRCHYEQSLETAETVLEAMREPTEAMIEAYFDRCRDLGFTAHITATAAWQAMIDAARTHP